MLISYRYVEYTYTRDSKVNAYIHYVLLRHIHKIAKSGY